MYLYLKIIHIIALICWMAGLFYLPRLFVYHVENAHLDKGVHEMFLTMQRKLYKVIMMPAHIITYLTGFHLMAAGDFMQQPWMHFKLFFVFLLVKRGLIFIISQVWWLLWWEHCWQLPRGIGKDFWLSDFRMEAS